MEGLAPPHQTIIDIRFALETGSSMRSALSNLLESENCAMKKEIMACFLAKERGQDLLASDLDHKFPCRRALQELMLAGLKGEPVLPTLVELESEVALAAKNNIEEHVHRLPLILTVYMLLFQMPAVVLVIVWPIIVEVLKGIL